MADRTARLDPLASRLGPSLCVVSSTGLSFLLDVSPDIKAQEDRLLRIPAYAARAIGSGARARAPFDAIALTHAHIGHYAGLVHFGREAASTDEIPCYCTPSMGAFLSKHAPWEQLVSLRNLVLRPLAFEREVQIWPGLNITALAVPHRGEYTDTVAISLNGKLLYVPDIDDWAAWPRAREIVAAHEVSLLDATFFSAEELPGREMREVPHPLVPKTLDFFSDLAGKRRLILTHLNHTNPLTDPNSAATREVTHRGFEVAQEMMAIEL